MCFVPFTEGSFAAVPTAQQIRRLKFKSRESSRAVEVAQGVKCLLHRHKDLCLDLKHNSKLLGVAGDGGTHACNASPGSWRTQGLAGQPVSLNQQTQGSGRDPSQEIRWGVTEEDTALMWYRPLLSALVYMGTESSTRKGPSKLGERRFQSLRSPRGSEQQD